MKKISFLLVLLLSLMLLSCNQSSNQDSSDCSGSIDTDTCTPVNTDTSTDTEASARVKGEPQDELKATQDEQEIAQDDQNKTQNSQKQTQGEEKMNDFVLKGKVLGLNSHLEIEVIESDYAFGTYWVIVPSNIPILDQDGNAISLSSLACGDIVNITYNGQTMLSLPPQIVALKIVVA